MNELIALLPAWCIWVAPVVIIGGMFAIIFGMAAKDRDRTTMIVIACIVVGTLAGALYTINQPHEWQPQDEPKYWPFYAVVAAVVGFLVVMCSSGGGNARQGQPYTGPVTAGYRDWQARQKQRNGE